MYIDSTLPLDSGQLLSYSQEGAAESARVVLLHK